ncbi:MAG TPA: transposase [Polyangia bacterium]|nr:transposase [Polyangia bacterium]
MRSWVSRTASVAGNRTRRREIFERSVHMSLDDCRPQKYAIQVMAQRSFRFRTWGGKRKGAGRPRKDGSIGKAGVAHLVRPALAERFPVHVTWRMQREVWNLRTQRCFRVMERAMLAGALKGGFRLVHYAVMGNHVHLIVEAPNRLRLARGMQGLGIRIARALNRVMGRSGRVMSDRYHAHILRTPSEVKRARAYVLDNARRHYGHTARDRFASQAPMLAPRTWLLRQSCRRNSSPRSEIITKCAITITTPRV